MRKYFKQLGQGMTEYIIIVALIAIAAIAVYGLFGKTIRNQVAGMSQELAGEKNTGTKQAADAANKAADKANTDQGLKNFGESK